MMVCAVLVGIVCQQSAMRPPVSDLCVHTTVLLLCMLLHPAERERGRGLGEGGEQNEMEGEWEEERQREAVKQKRRRKVR